MKDATTDSQSILSWWNRFPDANIAIRTGRESNLVVLDIDTKTQGFESLEALENTFQKLPDTLTAITGSQGKHICFTHPGGTIKNRCGIVTGVDIRADGGYIIAPPSLHICGGAYRWIDPEKPLQRAPEWLTGLLNKSASANSEIPEGKIPEGSRNSSMMSIGGKKWSEGMAKSALRTFLLEENQLRCSPPLPHEEVLKIITQITAYKQGEKKFLHTWKERFTNSELPNASKLVLHCLADHMNSQGRSCFPTQDQISVETSLTPKTVRHHLSLCEKLGWIKRYTHRADSQKFWNYGYIASLPDNIN